MLPKPKFPLNCPMKEIRRVYPSPAHYKAIMDKNPGCLLGVVSRTGANARTVTLTQLKVEFHPTTKKPSVTRKDYMIDDPLEEAQASDVILARNLGLISARKRHAFYKLVWRRGGPDDADRQARIMQVERERLQGVEDQRRARLAKVRAAAEFADGVEDA